MNRNGALLDDGYTSELQSMGQSETFELLGEFEDANLFQSRSYGKSRWPRAEFSTLVLKHRNLVVAMAQVNLLKIPFINGIAFVRWGPLWRRIGTPENTEVFRQITRALRIEFVERRGYALQLVPRESDDRDDLKQILEEEGFDYTASNYNTLLIDISGTEEEIRAALVPRWRTDLNRSIRNALKLEQGQELALYDRFELIFREMRAFKNFVDFGDLEMFRKVQSDLPDSGKMQILICASEDGIDGAGAITSAFGDTGLAILWATNHVGRDTRGAYLVQWEVIRWLKSMGCTRYDIGGVDRDAFPGGYRFKQGLAGKQANETRFLGQFRSSRSRVQEFLLNTAQHLRTGFWELKKKLKEKSKQPQKFLKLMIVTYSKTFKRQPPHM